MNTLVAESKSSGLPLPPLGETIDFLRLIWRVDHALHQASKRMQASLGVTGPQRLVIRIVGRFPGLTAGQLAEILYVDPSTMTGVLERLERRCLGSPARSELGGNHRERDPRCARGVSRRHPSPHG
jgi:hypothetical protein